MWKKFREASSGVSLNSVTNMFRSKSYSKFGSRDELCDDPSPSDDNVEVVDEENNFLSWPHDTRVSVQNDMSVNSNSTSNGDLSDTDDFGFGSKRDVHSRPRLWSNDEHTDYAPVSRDSRILSHRSENGHHGHIVSNPKTEVKELVNSFTQRRYQQLEESDESHESRNDNEGSQISDSDIENCVFHRVEDVHQNNKQKPAKPKKTKKIWEHLREASYTILNVVKKSFIFGYGAPMFLPEDLELLKKKRSENGQKKL